MRNLKFIFVLLLGSSGALAASSIELLPGQSVIVCRADEAGALEAVSNLNALLLVSRDVLKITAGGTPVTVEAPYTVSAPALTSYTSSIHDIACVTVTKE